MLPRSVMMIKGRGRQTEHSQAAPKRRPAGMQHMTSPELITLPLLLYHVPHMAFICKWLGATFFKVWVNQNWHLYVTVSQHWGSLNFSHQEQNPDHGHRLFPAWLDPQQSTNICGAEICGKGHVCPLPGNDSGLTLWLPENILRSPLPFLHTGVPYKWPFWMPPYPHKITIADSSGSRVIQSLFTF